ncbi:hypothetical protein LWI28_016657 [Acer negundo]|uniref:WRKY domain-containing protein n=1 Tax=Acer negundo TaxID=4023 RepID=A0AAD5J079_ACENE|nr:hypothetical protein LWI28_016657 [Acer negundo]KAK4845613.1 hypothetical protein QYF36_007085 [Acer negundo]
MVSPGKDVPDEVAPDKSQHGKSPDCGSHALEQDHVSGIRSLQSDQVGSTPLNVRKKESVEPDTSHSLRSDQQGSISSIKSEKASEITDIIPASQSGPEEGITPISQSGPEGSTPPMVREKVLGDGYNWRKYGQKLVRANEFIRSYYKCTHPNCRVKKQLDSTHDGRITDTIYFGQHDHPRAPNPPLAVGFVVSIVEERPDDPSLSVAKDKPSDTHGQTPHKNGPTANPQLSVATSNDVKPLLQSNRMKDEINEDEPGSKRRKNENPNASATFADKSTGEARLVVQSYSEVDIVNDGYRWRKYGQKLVKGNPNPRNYYRCSKSGCPVKKHVERASHDQKLVITTYEGRHDHDMPPSRTVTHNAAGQNSGTTSHNDESSTKLDGNNAVCLDMVVHSSPGTQSKSNEQLNTVTHNTAGQNSGTGRTASHNDESGTKLEENNALCLDLVVYSSPGTQSKSSEQLNGKSRTKSEVTGIDGGLEIVDKSSSSPVNKSTELQNGKSGTNTVEEKKHDSLCRDDGSNNQLNGESGTETEQNVSAPPDTVTCVTPCPETSFSEKQQTPNPEPVRS